MARTQVIEIAPREKILDIAEELFARRGYNGVGLSEIAEGAGLGKSSLFHHFRGKFQLYVAVVVRILSEIDTQLTRALASGGTAVERLDRWVDTLIDVLGQHPTYSRILLRSLFEDNDFGDGQEEQEANLILGRILEGIRTVLREGMGRGEIRGASIAHAMQSLVGLIVYHFASGEFGDQLLRRSIFDPSEVRRRKEELKALLHHGLVVKSAQ